MGDKDDGPASSRSSAVQTCAAAMEEPRCVKARLTCRLPWSGEASRTRSGCSVAASNGPSGGSSTRAIAAMRMVVTPPIRESRKVRKQEGEYQNPFGTGDGANPLASAGQTRTYRQSTEDRQATIFFPRVRGKEKPAA